MDVDIITAIIGAIGVIVGGIGGALIGARANNKTNSELQQELTKLRKSARVLPMLTREEYGIKIVSPAEYANVGTSFEASGTYENLPDGHVIYLSTFGIYEDKQGRKRKRYWPQSAARTTHDSDGKKWYCSMNNIGQDNESMQKEYLVLVVGREGQALFKYFLDAGWENKSWPAVTQLTSDVVECATGKVTYDPRLNR